MPEPIIARLKPYLQTLTAGKTYFWCRCGRSQNQPFCDGSHKGTEFAPLKYVAEADADVLFCGCKQTATPPLCDGTHNRLSDTYGRSEETGAAVQTVAYEAAAGGALKACLDGDCFAIRVPEEAFERHGKLLLHPVIGGGDNARFLSQFSARVEPGRSPILRFPGSDTALFVIAGEGRVRIGERDFAIARENGVCVKSGEAFSIENPGPAAIALNLTVCPPLSAPEWPDAAASEFEAAFPARVARVDQAKREKMGDRFFQVLLDEDSHGTEVTQFIGEIPRSRAAHHRHLYEETLTVLGGEGFIWTDRTKAPVRPGDTIFLPARQHHSLECTNPGGMRVVGVFYPSGSPAINY